MRDVWRRKNENDQALTVLRGGVSDIRGRRRGRRPGARVLGDAERELERELRDAFVVLKGADGHTPSRGIAAICAGEGTTPWRALGLRCLEAMRARSPQDRVRAVGERFLEWLDRQIIAHYGGDEHDKHGKHGHDVAA